MSRRSSINSNSSSYADHQIKGILKKNACNRSQSRTLTFDEDNVRETFHPIDKDYGYDIVDEPDTPYPHNETDGIDMDPNLLSEKLIQLKAAEEEEEDIEAKRQDFLRKRRELYQSEFKAAKELENRTAEDDENDRHKKFRNKRYLMASTEYKTAKRLGQNIDKDENDTE